MTSRPAKKTRCSALSVRGAGYARSLFSLLSQPSDKRDLT